MSLPADYHMHTPLCRHAVGEPVDDDFALVEVDLPAPDAAEILVHNTFLSVDPYMRGRTDRVKSDAPPFARGATIGVGATGGAGGGAEESGRPRPAGVG